MTRNPSRTFLVTAALMVPSLAVAQINLQQMPGYVPVASSTAGSDRNLGNSTGLRVVPENFEKLRLAPGFLIKLSVLDDSDFSGEFRIDEHGDIAVPVLGTVPVAGLTAAEARQQISKRLIDNQILKDPQVSFSILEYTAPQVTIIGEVAAPGKYPLLVANDLVDVLALAGGPTRLAGNEVRITPADGKTKTILLHYSKASDPEEVKDVLVHPGDTVQVDRAGIVYVLGAVNRPGGYVMQEEGTLSVLQAISLANGTSTAASTGTIYLMRRQPDGTEIDIALRYKKISQGKLADFRLHATDILFVPTSKMKSILTESKGVITSAASASIYAGILY